MKMPQHKAGQQPIKLTSSIMVDLTDKVEVREKLAQLGVSLPKPGYTLLQAFFTWLTGKPYRGQQPLFKHTPISQLATATLSLLGGITTSWIIVNSPPYFWLLLPISWLFTVGGARKLQTSICHQCIHFNFSGNKTTDQALAEIISTILVIQDFSSYRHDHIEVHHSKKLATLDDPDVKFLLQLGFYPGLTEKPSKSTLINP